MLSIKTFFDGNKRPNPSLASTSSLYIMSAVLLFCTAEEAKPLMPKVSQVKNVNGSQSTTIFWVVESRTCPISADGFKRELQQNEPFESEFIGAATEECQEWAREKQSQTNFVEPDIIAVADARTARDNTILMCYYEEEDNPEESPLEFPGFGALPQRLNTWYHFRIDYETAALFFVNLVYCPPDMAYPAFFGRKEELTDDNGVFDAEKAHLYVVGKGTEAGET
ncbi:hypothetical protein BDW42DRAFT_157854 [Aspergillus taichungensis]|uniref:Uncharacterized protein n=1 Tax=Aspergillus taichungensis TaxID=482145 RepID=A0A2J5IAA0_9EURO|nr:hypothetical protein BDW42DRAFT_157854 [Aspergillus taichungensis]